MEEKDIEHIIAKYLSGEATAEEVATLMHWLSADENNKTEFRKIQSYWNADVSFMHVPEFVPDFEKLKNKIKKSGAKKSRRGLWIRSAIAAAVVGVLVISQFVLKTSNTGEFTYITGSSVADFILPDGTGVTLNKNSKLSYAASFGKNSRTVSLDGEGYFDVVYDKEQQFIVNAGSAQVTVLGTVFSVRYKKDEDILKASLIEGSVKFETANQAIMLNPYKQILYNTRDNEITIERFDPEIETAWKDNLIRYKSVSFFEFIALLEKHYDVKITVPSRELNTSKLTGAIDANQSISQILDMMKKNINYEWRKNDDAYVITY